jgi:hypothetical protein
MQVSKMELVAQAVSERELASGVGSATDKLAPFHVEHGDFLPYALSGRRLARAQSPATSPCHYETGKSLGQT